SDAICSRRRILRDLRDGDVDFAEPVDAAGDPVTDDDGADTGPRTRHDEVAGRQRHRLRYARDDFGHTPDKLGQIRILFYRAVHRQPNPTISGMADLSNRL